MEDNHNEKMEFIGKVIEITKENTPTGSMPIIIQELDYSDVNHLEIIHGNANKMICNKINEIIEVVNKIMRGR